MPQIIITKNELDLFHLPRVGRDTQFVTVKEGKIQVPGDEPIDLAVNIQVAGQ